MEKMFEIRWHGRGGQGSVTAARLLAEVAVAEGYYAQAFPEFGPERRGAPVQAFTRLSNLAIRTYYGIDNPDVVIVLDSTLLNSIDVTHGLSKNGILLVNTTFSNNNTKDKFRLKARNTKMYIVNATAIAQDCLGVAIPNIAMIGAFVKATGILKLENAIDYFRKALKSRFSIKALEGNLKALSRAYEEVKIE